MALAPSKCANAENDTHGKSATKDVDTTTKCEPPQPPARPHLAEKKKRLSHAELEIARKLSFSAALEKEPGDDDTDEHKVQIVIRIRPLVTETTPEHEEPTTSYEECFRVTSETTLVAHPPKTSQSYRSTGTATSFHFSRIFTPETAQQDLFEATTRPVLEAAFSGKNGLVFAYGVTNSGKTYTITGTEVQAGVLPRALKYVMEELGRRKENEEAPVTKITASYLEIYNENVYDLLTAPVRKRRALRLQDCDGKIQVRGMLERPLKSSKDADELLAIGKKNKQVAETNCNMDSSRSHCIFSLYFYHQDSRGVTALRSKVSIVDLAGSERSAKTGATGLRMQEASKINGSLMNLMRCLETMRWNQQHPSSLQKMVPFRESKLTRLFQENLVGRKQGPVVMIVAVNPSSYEFDETLRTLKYSAMARELVPVQKNSGRKSTTSNSYYDLDGRLRKRRRTSAEGDAAPADEQTESQKQLDDPVKRESFGRHMKREPTQAVHRRPPRRVSRVPHAPLATAAANANAVVALMEREFEAHRKRTAKLVQENNDLRIQLSQTNAEKLEMEVKIRAEVGNEMQEQLQHIKAQFREMLERQRSGNDSSSTTSSSSQSFVDNSERAAWKQEKAAMQQKIQLLQEQLSECEDEMKRIQERHEQELESVLKRGHGEEVDEEEPEEI